jgi:acyl-CoA synthetase (AMP-forming)/AMP-acid ligase II
MPHPSHHARTQPDKVVYPMAGTGKTLTYRELDEASNRSAQLLRSLGLKAGDHMALLFENSLRFFEICWAAQRSGIYYTAISTYLVADEIAYIVGDCGARVFVVSDALRPLAEKLARLLPAGTDVAVFGVPDDEMGEEVKAVVQPSPGFATSQALADELIAFCKASLSPIKCPRSIDFKAELPRTPTGKLLKRLLRDQYWTKKG